ncbi:hypothetical protein BVI1335_830061 [Burkholderia vietnamiensis]|nr:hypothetical protein BVI1335_830061 [Burkholderia vietnamiensis]
MAKIRDAGVVACMLFAEHGLVCGAKKKGPACAEPFLHLVANQGFEPRTCGL